jgi:hypothetical protein
MITAFIMANLAQIIGGGSFLTGFGIYSYYKMKGYRSKKFKVQYCDVTPVIKQYKQLDKNLNERVGGNKNDKFFS